MEEGFLHRLKYTLDNSQLGLAGINCFVSIRLLYAHFS
ncbi:hypothetical protein BN1221_03881 [Brenneria goodwinii]|uniref:Uncharacterized protein n=1 Tax=Brenneria goodwinii TaxID=1109412 RepID=A0A0G4JZM7_9GAMM|nr:hypothetical protein BN1221_03881 [Brenneria goodwinii]